MRDVARIILPDPIVFIQNTSTTEKTHQYKQIATLSGMNLVVLNAKDFKENMPSALENTGTGIGNVIQKAEKSKALHRFLQSNRPQDLKIITKIMSQRGLKFNPERTFISEEDSTVTLLETGIWLTAREMMFARVSQDLLDRADNNGTRNGLGAETGLIASALSWQGLANVLRVAGLENGTNYVGMMDEACLSYRPVTANIDDEPKIIQQSVEMCIAQSLMDKDIILPSGDLHVTRHFFALATKPATPTNRFWPHFLANQSVRSKALRRFVEEVCEMLDQKKKAHAVSLPRKLMLRAKNIQWHNGNIKAEPVRQAVITHIDGKFKPSYQTDPRQNPVRAAQELLGSFPSLDNSDLMIFYPKTDMSREEKIVATYIFKCADVDATVTDKNAPKRLIVLNDGSWDTDLNLRTYFTNHGFHKDYVRSTTPPVSLGSCVRYLSLANVDVVSCRNVPKLFTAGRKLANYYKEKYKPFLGQVEMLDAPIRAGLEMPVAFNNPTLAIFCSASNLNAPNTLGAYELARAAVGHGADFLYGAGDVENAPMWGSLQGALHGQIEHAVRKNTSYNLPRIWGISTLPLIKKETEEAKPPQGLDGSLIVNTLPEREGYLTTGGRITVPFAGGIGSDRENYARLVILPRFLPEVVRGKAFVISPINLVSHTGDGVNCYNDVPFGAMLGKRALAQLKKNPWALASEGIYYPRTQQELVQTTLRALDGGLGSLAPKPLRSPVPTRTVSHEQVLSLSACSK